MTYVERFGWVGRKRHYRHNVDRLRWFASYIYAEDRALGIALAHLIDTGRLTTRADQTIRNMSWPAVLKAVESIDRGNNSADAIQKGFYAALGCTINYI